MNIKYKNPNYILLLTMTEKYYILMWRFYEKLRPDPSYFEYPKGYKNELVNYFSEQLDIPKIEKIFLRFL